MTEITSISVSLKECSSSEADESNSNLNGSVDYKVIEKDNCKALEINKTDESVNKGVSNIPVSSSMQDQPFTVLRSNKSLSSMSSDYIGNIGNSNAVTSLTAESASFALLSRRESSLENLAEDETCLHNVCVSPFIDVSNPNIVEKPAVIENAVNIPKKIESSRLRRTLSSLLSCCTQKSRRSQYPYKTDLITTPVGDSDTNLTIDKCSNISTHKQATSRSAEGDHISFSCLKLKKFLDIFDESDSPLKRGQQSTKADTNRSMTTTCITRDTDKSDSPSKTMKNTDAFQSENGGANLIRPVLLGTVKPADQGKKCFIIDLDETLVHSSFKMVEKADFKVGVDIEGTVHTVYVLKRPYVDVFLQRMGRIFECVLFTASLAKYADPVTDFLDKWRVFRWRLFRESCVFHRGNYVKDLSMLGRQADQVAILDNSPASYMFHPDNAVQITSWFDDPRDTALLDLIPYFEQLAAAPSVPPFLASVKPPQRATVPISVMLATPTSISLQPVSPHQLQNQQHTSSSPITSVEPCVVASSADHHSDSNSPAVSQTIYLPISSYIGSQIPSSIKSLSMISSKSMPSMYSEDECVSSLGAKFSRSETDLANLSSVVHIKSEANGRAGAGGSGSRGGAEQDAYPQRVFSKSTTNIPTVLTYDDIFPKLVLNSLASRSFPTLLSGDRYKSELTEESQNGLQTISISKKYFLPPRSASFSVQRFPAEKTHRSNSLSEPRVTGIFNSFFTD